MHMAEVPVFDANATVLDVQISDLMEAAGQALATEVARISEQVEGAKHREIWILCGPGNNGGDGLVAARSGAIGLCVASLSRCAASLSRCLLRRRTLRGLSGLRCAATALGFRAVCSCLTP